jgi:TolB protein
MNSPTRHGKLIPGLILVALMLIQASAGAQADAYLDITKSALFKVPIVVEDFSWLNSDPVIFQGRQRAEEVLIDDLLFSDAFIILRLRAGQPLASGLRLDVLGQPVDQPVQARLRAEISRSGSRLKLKARLLDETSGNEIFKKDFHIQFDPEQVAADRWGIHRLADEISYYLSGVPGSASTRIAFIRSVDAKRDVYLIDWDGMNETALTDLRTIMLSPTWRNKGERVAFTSFHQGHPCLYHYDLKKRETKLITRDTTPSAPKYSPDGKHIAYCSTKEGNAEIYIAKANGSKPIRLTHHAGIDTAPSWSPSGKHLVFTSDRWGNPQLFIISTDGSDLRQLTFAGKWNDSADWSPVKDRIVHVCRVENEFELGLIHADGMGWRLLTIGGGCENPRWAPDGRHIVFARSAEGNRSLWILDADTGSLRRLTRFGEESYNPAWSHPARERLSSQKAKG